MTYNIHITEGVVCGGSSVEVTAVWGIMTVTVPLLARFTPVHSAMRISRVHTWQFITATSLIGHNNNNVSCPAQILSIKTAH